MRRSSNMEAACTVSKDPSPSISEPQPQLLKPLKRMLKFSRALPWTSTQGSVGNSSRSLCRLGRRTHRATLVARTPRTTTHMHGGGDEKTWHLKFRFPTRCAALERSEHPECQHPCQSSKGCNICICCRKSTSAQPWTRLKRPFEWT